MTLKRFSLRTALIGVFIAAILFAFGPRIYRCVKYIGHYQRLTTLAASWTREPNKCEGYTFRAANGTWLSVSTAEQEVSKDFSTATYNGAMPDPNRFFVVPPGKWVDSIDEVLATWDNYD